MEFLYDKFDEEQCREYLDRIGFTFDGEVTKENLDAIVWANQKAVPFENLAPGRGLGTLELSKEALFQKVVRDRRGGFCFELNGALYYLLRGLGYDCYSVLSRIVGPNRPGFGGMAHRGIVVRIDGGECYVDVGFGGVKPPFAVMVNAGNQTVRGKTYRVQDGENGWRVLWKETEEGGAPVLQYSVSGFQDFEFGIFCDAMVAPPDAGFRVNTMANICTEDGYFDFRNGTLTEVRGEEKTVREASEDEFEDLMKNIFGIDIPGLREKGRV